MAAKVVMVAVPAVLGIASIRVHTVNEVPAADGLVSREQLNIYTPLSDSAQAHLFPESPGVIERSLTAARESTLPLVQAAKGVCVSVKRGSINLYHTGEDAYYYLIDPPPGFLPRFGTITMAGLLGMFLARKGSRFKRFAVPLGLMSAGASVCYPAQTVAVLKVTGRNVYAAGQWSGAAVSSLFSAMKPAAKEAVASHAESASELNPESVLDEETSGSGSTVDSLSQSSVILESAESVPVSDEPVVSDTPDEPSVTVTEISPTQVPTETSSVQTEIFPPSEEAAPVGDEGGADKNQAAENVSTDTRPAEPTPSLELETVPVESASAVSEEEEVSSHETPDVPEAPAVDSTEPEPVAEPESADLPSVPAAGSTPTLTPPPPPSQPAAENSKEGAVFKADPSLMDFGQSSPEDEDLYSTRS